MVMSSASGGIRRAISHTVMNLFHRFAPVWLTAGLIVWIEDVFTIEWTYPYCLDRSDGPAYAAHGMPLPYWMWNGVSSLEHDFVPHVYILNIILLGLLLFPVIRWIFDRLVSRDSKWLRTAIAAAGVLLLATHVVLMLILVSVGFYRPATSLGLGDYYRYTDFRPVRFGFRRSNAPDCMPSTFWFPEGWQHK